MNNIVSIKSKGVVAKINLSRGANLFSLNINGVSVLREPDYSKPLDNPYLYGMPILFPVNRIEGGSFTFEGREYLFPINEEKTNCHLHGELHKSEFNVIKQKSNVIVCEYLATKNNRYLDFLHEFSVRLEYRLIKNGVKIKTTITNKVVRHGEYFDVFFFACTKSTQKEI